MDHKLQALGTTMEIRVDLKRVLSITPLVIECNSRLLKRPGIWNKAKRVSAWLAHWTLEVSEANKLEELETQRVIRLTEGSQKKL